MAEETETAAESLKKESLGSSKKAETTTEASEVRTHNNSSNSGSFANLEFLQITPTTIQVTILKFLNYYDHLNTALSKTSQASVPNS